MAPSSAVVANSRSFAVASVRRNSGWSGLKKARGCGSKVSAAAGRPSAVRAGHRGADHRAMAAMHALEIAHRDHRAPERAGLRRQVERVVDDDKGGRGGLR